MTNSAHLHVVTKIQVYIKSLYFFALLKKRRERGIEAIGGILGVPRHEISARSVWHMNSYMRWVITHRTKA
jgi:hypothetical protein